MNRYLVVGTSFKEGDGAFREMFHMSADEPENLRSLYDALGVDELVYLATCNRVEFIMADRRETSGAELLDRVFSFFSRRRDTDPSDSWSGAFHVHRGADAVRHLFRVASSLDSMVVGEAQILGQVKRAYLAAMGAGIACSWLECLFEETFRCARQVRRRTSLGSGSVSMASLAVGAVTAERRPMDAAITIVGSGEMSSKVAMFLRSRGHTNLRLVNRTPAKVRANAVRYNAEVMALDAYLEAPPATDVIVTATSAPQAIFDRRSLEPLTSSRQDTDPLLIVDLAAPRDTDPELDDQAGVRIVTIDDLRAQSEVNSKKAASAVGAAERAVAEAIDQYPIAMERRLVDVLCVDPVAAGML